MNLLKTIKDSVLSFQNWVRTGTFSLAVGSQAVSEMKAIERTSTIRALFITSDRGLFGINEELWATIDHERDICVIHGLDRAFFGHKKTGIVTYTTLNGQRWALVSDGQHNVIDHMDYNEGKFSSPALNLDDIYSLEQIISNIKDDKKRVEWEEKLKELDLKKLGVCLDLTIADDHENKKDLSIWAIKAMSGGFFKSLTQFPLKIIILIGLCCWLMGISMVLVFEVVTTILLILLWLIFH